MKISVCIPMYNESSVIADTARTLSAYMSSEFEDYEIIFSDDGSKDGSAEIVEALNLPNVKVVKNPINQGKGSAVRLAMMEASGDYILFTDADLAYGTRVIQDSVETFLNHPESDLVVGSRNINKDGYNAYTLSRKLASKLYIGFLCFVGGFDLSDSQCGCKAFSSKAAKEIFSRCTVNGFSFDFEVFLWANALGLKITEMPVKILHHRESKIRLFRDSFKMVRDILQIRRRVRAKIIQQQKTDKTQK